MVGRTLAALLALNVLTHFVPFERPGHEPDDYVWLSFARAEPPGGYASLSLSQPTRPLGWLLYIMQADAFGLDPRAQLAMQVASTSILTGLVYVFLAGVFGEVTGRTAALLWVLWPVKHQIYASLLFTVIHCAAILALAAGLLWRRYARRPSGETPALAGSLAVFTLSLFVYELSALAPVVFWMTERRAPRGRSAGLFAIPFGLYLMWRFVVPAPALEIGRHAPDVGTVAYGVFASLPSNVAGFQLARNVGYGLRALADVPAAWLVFDVAAASAAAALAARWTGVEGGIPSRRTVLVCVVAAFVLALPAGAALVESRHMILASCGVASAIAVGLARWPRAIACVAFIGALASQGLAFRQVEASRMQAAMWRDVEARRDELRSASVAVFDLASFASRVEYTWGDRRENVLRAYWGIHTFAPWQFSPMVSLATGTARGATQVVVCAEPILVIEGRVECSRRLGRGTPWRGEARRAVVFDWSSVCGRSPDLCPPPR